MSLIKQLRSYRISEMALFDIIASVIGMIWLSSYIDISKLNAALLAIPIGVITHWVLGINTELNYKLGISNKPIKE